jgi:hypothetical protein
VIPGSQRGAIPVAAIYAAIPKSVFAGLAALAAASLVGAGFWILSLKAEVALKQIKINEQAATITRAGVGLFQLTVSSARAASFAGCR